MPGKLPPTLTMPTSVAGRFATPEMAAAAPSFPTQYVPPDPSMDGELVKGLSRATESVAPWLQALGGLAESQLNSGYGRVTIADAQRQLEAINERAPAAFPSIFDTHSFSDLGQWATGKVGEMAPTAAPVAAATLLTGGATALLPAAAAAREVLATSTNALARAAAQKTLRNIALANAEIGGTAVMAPTMMGDKAIQLQTDPAAANLTDAQRLLHASTAVPEAMAASIIPGRFAARGVRPVGAAVDSAVRGNAAKLAPGVAPNGIAGRMASAAAATPRLASAAFGEGLENTAVAGGVGAGMNAIDQADRMSYDPNYKFNVPQMLDAGAGMMGGVGPVAAVHGMGGKGVDYAAAGGRAAAGAARAGAGKLAGKLTGAAEAARSSDAASTMSDAASLLRNNFAANAKMPELAKFLSEQTLPPELAKSTTEQKAAWLAADNSARKQTAIDIATRQFNDPDAPQFQKDAAQQFLSNADDPAAWQDYAAGMQLKQQQERFATNVGVFASSMKGRMEDLAAKSKLAAQETVAGVNDPKVAAGRAATSLYAKAKDFVSGKRDMELTGEDVIFTKKLAESPGAEPLTAVYQQDPKQAAQMSQLLRQWGLMDFGHTEDPSDLFVPHALIDTFGRGTPAVIATTAKLLNAQGHEIPAEAVTAAQKLATTQLEARKTTHQIVRDNMTLESQDVVHNSQVPLIAQVVREHVRGGKPSATVERQLDAWFGKNKEKVLDAFAMQYAQDEKHLPRQPQSSGLDRTGEGEVHQSYEDRLRAQEEGSNDFENAAEGKHETYAPVDKQYFGRNKEGAPFDTTDPYFAKSRDLKAQEIARNDASVSTRSVEGVPHAQHDMVGVVDHALEQAGHPEGTDRAAVVDKLLAKHAKEVAEGGDMTRAQQEAYLNSRLRMMRPRAKHLGESPDAIDIPTKELSRPATVKGSPNKSSWQDVKSIGTVQTDTIAHGRIFLRTADGKDFVTSAQKLISKMWEAKKNDAFQGETAEGAGAKDKLAMFSAGLTSLLDAKDASGKPYFDGTMRVKLKDGTVVEVGRDLPKDFNLFDSGKSKLTLEDAMKQEPTPRSKPRSAEEIAAGVQKSKDAKGPTQKYETTDLPNMTGREIAQEGQRMTRALEQSEYATLRDGKQTPQAAARMREIERNFGEDEWKLKGAQPLPEAVHAGLEAKRDAFREAYDARELLTRAPGEKIETAGNIGPRLQTVNDSGEPRMARTKHHGVTEDDEMFATSRAEHDAEARKFDETTGEELHPKERLKPDAKVAQAAYKAAADQYTALAAKIKELAAKTSVAGAAKRAENLRAMRTELAVIADKGKKIAAQLSEAQRAAVAKDRDFEQMIRDAFPEKKGGATDDNVGYARSEYERLMQKASDEPLGSTPITAEQKAEVVAHVEKVLGPKMKVAFSDKLLGSGEWSQGLIKVATSALNPLSIAHHEAMHELFSRIVAQKHVAADVLMRFANSYHTVRQIEREFAGQGGVLRSMRADPEERLTYAYQLWAANKLTTGPAVTKIFQKVANGIRRALGLLSDEQKVNDIFAAFHDGRMAEPSAMAHVLDTIEARGELTRKLGKSFAPVAKKAGEFWFTAEHQLTGSSNPELNKIGRAFNNATGSVGDKQGYLQAKLQQENQFMNKIGENIRAGGEHVEQKDVQLALEALQKGTTHPDAVIAKIQQGVRKTLDDMFDYMKGANVGVFDAETGKWRSLEKQDNYFPRAWDVAKLTQDSGRFKELLLQNHRPELEGIAKKANAEVAAGEDAGEYTASWEKAQNPDGKGVTAEDVADSILKRLISANGVDHAALKETSSSLGFSPFAKAVNKRTLDFVDMNVFHEFQQKDLVRTMTSYIGQATARAEYTRRFGQDGSVLQKHMDSAFNHELNRLANDEGIRDIVGQAQALMGKDSKLDFADAVEQVAGGGKGERMIVDAVQALEPAKRAIMAMEGTLGHDVSPLVRKLNGYNIVYQNTRLLGYALMSNLIDPLGVMVRGGTMKESYETFKRGMTEVFKEWGDLSGLRESKASDRDAATLMAEDIGTIDNAGFLSSMGTMYGSQYLPEGLRKWNDNFFRWNGMEGFNKGVRIMATQAAINFIKRHAQTPNEHSTRYLKELGLTKADVKFDADGSLNVDAPGMSQAIMRWVDGAVMRPNAAIRPAWGSDPHFASFFHLKQFMYATNEVLLKRVAHEIRNGNSDPLFVLMAGYIPVMLASDAAKGVLQVAMGAGAPAWEHDGFAGLLAHGAQRAGLTGVYQMPLDAVHFGPLELGGPAVEQVASAVTQPLGQTLKDAVSVGPLGLALKGMAWND